MMRHHRHDRLGLLQALLLALAAVSSATQFDPLAYVDPLIGTTNGGNVFPGASLPYGMAKAVADVDGQNTGGFGMDNSNVTGFSCAHDSGTGGNPSLGNFPLFPQMCPGDDLNNCQFRIGDRKLHYDPSSVVAEPGLFGIELESGIQARITTSEHASLIKFRFPSSSAKGHHPLILLDLTDLWQSRQNASIQLDDKSGRMVGNGTFLPSFGAGSYQLHFCVDFFGAKIHETGVWVNNRAGTEPKQIYITRGFNLFYLEGGGFARFSPGSDDTVTARVGLSFKSSKQACSLAEEEIPNPLEDFDRLVQTAKTLWREKLSPISVKAGGTDKKLLTSFWSGVYRNMQSPQNLTGQNPHWDTGKPYFDSFYW
jgi:putative alpha-1,2-mannosidase